MTRVYVLGNATVDIVQRTRRLPKPGETLLCDGVDRCAGGKGLNQAICCARAGVRTIAVLPIGRDSDGRFLANTVAREIGIDPRWIECHEPTDLSSIWVDAAGENAILSSAACARGLTREQATGELDDLQAGDFLLLQGNLDREVSLAAARWVKDRGATVALNTAPIAWDMGALADLADIVIANEHEAAQLGYGEDDMSIGGDRALIVTLGAAGACVHAASGRHDVQAPVVTAVDTAGAGDVAVGTLVANLALGRPLLDSVAHAMRAAALSVTRRGTTPSFPTPAELKTLV